jgi:hypothetical protein
MLLCGKRQWPSQGKFLFLHLNCELNSPPTDDRQIVLMLIWEVDEFMKVSLAHQGKNTEKNF